EQPLAGVLAVVPCVRDQDPLDQVGVVDEDDAAGAEPERDDVPEFAGTAREEGEKVVELVDVAAEEAAPGTGRRGRAGHGDSGAGGPVPPYRRHRPGAQAATRLAGKSLRACAA